MKNIHKAAVLLMIVSLILAACAAESPSQPLAVTQKAAETNAATKPIAADLEKKTSVPAAGGKPTETAAPDIPGWYTISLKDVNSGTNFTIQSLKGKVILLETMAQWCSNCLQQQTQVKTLHGMLGKREDFASVVLDIDSKENEASLKEYSEKNGFVGLYVVSPPEVSRELSRLYGSQFLNPPSTPMLIIDRKGTAHPLPFGIKSAEDLKKALEPYLNEK